jgi:hypothetical protein
MVVGSHTHLPIAGFVLRDVGESGALHVCMSGLPEDCICMIGEFFPDDVDLGQFRVTCKNVNLDLMSHDGSKRAVATLLYVLSVEAQFMADPVAFLLSVVQIPSVYAEAFRDGLSSLTQGVFVFELGGRCCRNAELMCCRSSCANRGQSSLGNMANLIDFKTGCVFDWVTKFGYARSLVHPIWREYLHASAQKLPPLIFDALAFQSERCGNDKDGFSPASCLTAWPTSLFHLGRRQILEPWTDGNRYCVACTLGWRR